MVDTRTVQLIVDHVDDADLINLADHLGIAKIDRFADNFSGLAYKVMRVWQERNGSSATLRRLAESLIAIGRSDVVAAMKTISTDEDHQS